jgi:hypothetical protein
MDGATAVIPPPLSQETALLPYADTVGRLRQDADLAGAPLFGAAWSESVAFLEAGAAGHGLLLEGAYFDRTRTFRPTVCAAEFSLSALSRNAALRYIPAEECYALLLAERQRRAVFLEPLRRALQSRSARRSAAALRRWGLACRRAAAAARVAARAASTDDALLARQKLQRRYAIFAGVLWDAAVRSFWRHGWAVWAAGIRGDSEAAARLAASCARRRLAAAWHVWRETADGLHGDRSRDRNAQLALLRSRARAALKWWRSLSRVGATLRRVAGKTIPRRRCVRACSGCGGRTLHWRWLVGVHILLLLYRHAPPPPPPPCSARSGLAYPSGAAWHPSCGRASASQPAPPWHNASSRLTPGRLPPPASVLSGGCCLACGHAASGLRGTGGEQRRPVTRRPCRLHQLRQGTAGRSWRLPDTWWTRPCRLRGRPL